MKNIYIYYLEQMRVRVKKTWRYLHPILFRYASITFFTSLFMYLFIYFFLPDEIFPIQLIRILYLVDPLKLVLYALIFTIAIPLGSVLVAEVWEWLPIMWKKYISLCSFIYLSFHLSIEFLTDEIVSGQLEYESYLELIKMLYSENPLKSVLPFSIFAMVMSLWSVVWRVIDKNIEFKNAEFAQNELRFSNAVNLLSKKEDPIFPSEGIRELARLKSEHKIDSKRVDQLTSSGIKIKKGQFASADLIGIDLSNAELSLSNLKNADIKDANLKNAILKKADLENANLDGTNLESAVLTEAKLSNATLKNANLKNANLKSIAPHNSVDPDISKPASQRRIMDNIAFESPANALIDVNLENANLENANLKNADFTGANLKNANLKNANLENTKFIGANLTNAKLENTNHEKADFTGANLKGTILENRGL